MKLVLALPTEQAESLPHLCLYKISSMPPNLELDRLDCRASIDYLSVICHESRPAVLPVLSCIPKWHKARGESTQTLTLHDPSRADIAKVAAVMDNPMLFKMELAVDFKPKASVELHQRELLLRNTFVALAARFRPEDMTPWGYGPRGGLTGPNQIPLPFHQRLPSPEEELIYGRRGDWLQSKLYLKRIDQGDALPPDEHRVRMELTLRRGGLIEFQLDRLQDVLGYALRSRFTKHFRIVSGARLRVGSRKLDDTEQAKRERRMLRAWATAGVGKFAVSPELPFETSPVAARQIKNRAVNQLSLEHYRLVRDQDANAKIGDAFKKLQLRMTR